MIFGNVYFFEKISISCLFRNKTSNLYGFRLEMNDLHLDFHDIIDGLNNMTRRQTEHINQNGWWS